MFSKNKTIYRNIKNNVTINTNYKTEDIQYLTSEIIKPQIENEANINVPDLIKIGIDGESYCKLRNLKYGKKEKALTKTQKNKILNKFSD